MARKTQRDQYTLNLFEMPKPADNSPGGLNFTVGIRHLLSDMLKDSAYDRFEVAARMSKYLGVEVTKYQLDSWTGESRSEWRFPVEYLVAFEAACDCGSKVTEFLVEKRGGLVSWGKAAYEVKLGAVDAKIEKLKKEQRILKKMIEG